MAHPHDHDHHAPTHSSDTKAAFFGLVIGALVLFAVLRTIVYLTNAHYAHEQPAAASTK
jgi:hypothetical protein